MANAGTYNHTKQHFAEGAAAATPDAGEVVIYAKTDGLLYSKDDAGSETLVSGGSGGGSDITGDDAWVAKGDLIAGTTTDTAGIVTVGSNGSSLRANSGATQGIEWQMNNLAASAAPTANDDTGDGYSVGSRWIDTTNDKEYVCLDATSTAAVWTETTQTGGGGGSSELAYVEFTSTVSITATTEAGSDTVVSAGAVSFDGSTTVHIEFFAPYISPVVSSAGAVVIVTLFDGASSIGKMAMVGTPGTSQQRVPTFAVRRLTPSNASHTYSVRAYVTTGTGTVNVAAGGSGNVMPGYVRIVTV